MTKGAPPPGGRPLPRASLAQVRPELVEGEHLVAVEVTGLDDHLGDGLGDIPVTFLSEGGLELGSGDEAVTVRVDPLEVLACLVDVRHRSAPFRRTLLGLLPEVR